VNWCVSQPVSDSQGLNGEFRGRKALVGGVRVEVGLNKRVIPRLGLELRQA
jgi:hypothetical protein